MKQYQYFFDCLDGTIGDKYITAIELNELLTGKSEPMTEKEIIETAADYEATLYRREIDEHGNPSKDIMLYDCEF